VGSFAPAWPKDGLAFDTTMRRSGRRAGAAIHQWRRSDNAKMKFSSRAPSRRRRHLWTHRRSWAVDANADAGSVLSPRSQFAQRVALAAVMALSLSIGTTGQSPVYDPDDETTTTPAPTSGPDAAASSSANATTTAPDADGESGYRCAVGGWDECDLATYLDSCASGRAEGDKGLTHGARSSRAACRRRCVGAFNPPDCRPSSPRRIDVYGRTASRRPWDPTQTREYVADCAWRGLLACVSSAPIRTVRCPDLAALDPDDAAGDVEVRRRGERRLNDAVSGSAPPPRGGCGYVVLEARGPTGVGLPGAARVPALEAEQCGAATGADTVAWLTAAPTPTVAPTEAPATDTPTTAPTDAPTEMEASPANSPSEAPTPAETEIATNAPTNEATTAPPRRSTLRRALAWALQQDDSATTAPADDGMAAAAPADEPTLTNAATDAATDGATDAAIPPPRV